MRITSRWGKSLDRQPFAHQPFALHGRGCVRALRVNRLRHHAAQFVEGTALLRPLLFRLVRRWTLCRRMGDGADPAVGSGPRRGSLFSFDRTLNHEISRRLRSHHYHRRIVALRLAEQKMKVPGHHNVSHHNETITTPQLLLTSAAPYVVENRPSCRALFTSA